jgi:hypothetical protein
VLVHAVGLNEEGWTLVRKAGASVIWCPRSNLFTLGKTLEPQPGIPMALGTDSSLTTEGDLLDELEHTSDLLTDPLGILHLPPRPDDWIAVSKSGAPPELVVIGGAIHLISPRLAQGLRQNLRHEFHRLNIQTRPSVLVRWNIPQLLRDTRRYLGPDPVRLAGRDVTL